MRAELNDSFAEMAAGQLPSLRRFAYAVCGDWHRADDLVQGALERLYVAWPRVHTVSDPGAYARTVPVRLATSETRRAWWRRERVVERLPETPVIDHAAVTAERLDLAEALAGLSVKQRAIVVLRFSRTARWPTWPRSSASLRDGQAPVPRRPDGRPLSRQVRRHVRARWCAYTLELGQDLTSMQARAYAESF